MHLEIGQTIKIQNYCLELNGRAAKIIAIDGAYIKVQWGNENEWAEIYPCEIEGFED